MNMRKIEEIVATFMYIGKFSRMPGTLGSVAAFIIFRFVDIPILVFLPLVLFGGYCAGRYSEHSKIEDPSEVVIDEVAGMWVAMYNLPSGFGLPALFLFRILDILKPFPINLMEKLPGGTGIMADDIVAGIFVNIILIGATWLYFQGGLAFLFS